MCVIELHGVGPLQVHTPTMAQTTPLSYEQIVEREHAEELARARERMFGDGAAPDKPSHAVTRDQKLMAELWTIVNNLMPMVTFAGEERPMNTVTFGAFCQNPDAYISIINEMVRDRAD